jgi:hypothetical protein
MSASATDRVLGVSLLARDVPRDYTALADALVAFYRACGRPAQWISPTARTSLGRRRKFRDDTLRAIVTDDENTDVMIGTESNITEHEISCFLRPRSPSNQDYTMRWVTLTATGVSFDTPAVRALLAALIDLYPIAQGAVGGYRSLAYAAQECSFSGAVSPFDLDEPTRARLSRDQRLRLRFLQALRRLYPITIIGPNLWSQLPPIPEVEAMPVVETVGDCKLIHAWPTLVEPRDPEFLAGTVELRRWLWPYTIQNPADAIDA